MAPDFVDAAAGGGYIFEYFETSATIQGVDGTETHPGHVCALYRPRQVQIVEVNQRVTRTGTGASPPPLRVSRTWFHVEGQGLDACLEHYAIPVDRVMTGAFGALSLIPFMEEVRRHLIQRGNYWEHAVTLLCRRFFRNLARVVDQKVGRGEPSLYQQENLSILRRLRAQIHSNLRHRWTIDEMAALAHLSPAYYRQLYTGHFHVSPIDDLIGARIRRAKLLMQFSSLSIEQIAEECGFSSTPQFHASFRNRSGLTPGEYIRASRQHCVDRAGLREEHGDRLDNIALLYGEPAGYWNFDDEDGVFDQDYHFRYPPVKLLHGATRGDSPWGAALRLDGNRAHGEVPDAVVDTAESFTVCAWVLIAEGKPDSDWMTAVSIGLESHCSFYLQFCCPDNRFMFTMAHSSTNFDTTHVRGKLSGIRETWVHLCGVHNRESGTISLWENGELSETLEFRSAWAAVGPTRFGAGVFWGQISDIWTGRLAEIRLYGRALGANEIKCVYSHRQPRARQSDGIGDRR